MTTVNVHDAKTHLSRYLRAAQQDGESFVIARDGLPVARLIPCKATTPSDAKLLNALEGLLWRFDEDDEPEADVLAAREAVATARDDRAPARAAYKERSDALKERVAELLQEARFRGQPNWPDVHALVRAYELVDQALDVLLSNNQSYGDRS